MTTLKIGITGQGGFIGSHLAKTLQLDKERYEIVDWHTDFFANLGQLREFVSNCDIIIHLAAMNRHQDTKVIYETNVALVQALIDAMELEQVFPIVLFSSSTQESLENDYGLSKKIGSNLLKAWAKKHQAKLGCLVIPNVFGPFCKPNYNSFVATFCHKLTHKEEPEILQDSTVDLIYVSNLCRKIIEAVDSLLLWSKSATIKDFIINADMKISVKETLAVLKEFRIQYFEQGVIPDCSDINIRNLFNTFRSYIDYPTYFPKYLTKHIDARGSFIETIRLHTGGQVSFSTTVAGITRGNHYHTRKVERFTVIKGKARIQLRKIGSNEVINYELDGDKPSYVDMPIWYTHNITNIGDEDLYTQFWIDEWYDPDDPDTFFEEV